jgi:hypothetical protein
MHLYLVRSKNPAESKHFVAIVAAPDENSVLRQLPAVKIAPDNVLCIPLGLAFTNAPTIFYTDYTHYGS